MPSTLPLAKILVNKSHAARRIAARIASAFVPTRNLPPMINEALCYGCMAGIVMPIHHDIAPRDRGHDERRRFCEKEDARSRSVAMRRYEDFAPESSTCRFARSPR